MSAPWFHASRLPDEGETLELETDESRHAAAARRLEPGHSVVLFDGHGGLADAVFEERTASRTVLVRVESVRQLPLSQPALHLAAALPKGDRQSTLVSMATQLGLASLTPLVTRRSVTQPGKNAVERWQRVALAACKQSRNPWLPVFEEESKPGTFAHRHAGSTCILLHPGEGARGLGEVMAEAGLVHAREVALMVGPEGGFCDDEVAACVAAGARSARLGTTILRTETAGVAALAALRAHLGT